MAENLEILTLEYLHTLDSSLEKLSQGFEGKVTDLPGWALENRRIDIGFTPDNQGVIIKITPDENLEHDFINRTIITNSIEVNELISPFKFEGHIDNISANEFIVFGQMQVVNKDNPLEPPPLDDHSLIGWGNMGKLDRLFSIEAAKNDAITFWNNAIHGIPKTSSYVFEVNAILRRFRGLIKRKAFLERRIHRFINQYPKFLLPSFKKCYFEYPIYYDNQVRKADFILEREAGFPALFIELESPSSKIFTKKRELTKEANHAKNQIAEWVSFIDRDAKRNAAGIYSFLSGPKQRLVIIGRGLEHRDLMLNTKFSDTTFWTYDLLIENARLQLNDNYVEQCKLIGANIVTPF